MKEAAPSQQDWLTAWEAGTLSVAQCCDLRNAEQNAILELGIEKFELGFIQEAKILFQTLTYIDPHESRYHRLLGIARHRANELSTAEESYRKTLSLEPTDATVQCHLTEVLIRQNKVQEARIHLKAARACETPYTLPRLNRLEASLPQEQAHFDSEPARAKNHPPAKPPSSPPTQPTVTALVPRRKNSRKIRKEQTQTAIVRRIQGKNMELDSDESDNYFQSEKE